MRRPVLQPRLSLFWRALPPALCLLLTTLYTPISAQIAVPDRLPDGRRMTAFTTPAEFGHLPFDSLRTLPPSQGGRDTWWHRHALFSDGALQLALDPIVDISLDRRRLNAGGPTPSSKGFATFVASAIPGASTAKFGLEAGYWRCRGYWFHPRRRPYSLPKRTREWEQGNCGQPKEVCTPSTTASPKCGSMPNPMKGCVYSGGWVPPVWGLARGIFYGMAPGLLHPTCSLKYSWAKVGYTVGYNPAKKAQSGFLQTVQEKDATGLWGWASGAPRNLSSGRDSLWT